MVKSRFDVVDKVRGSMMDMGKFTINDSIIESADPYLMDMNQGSIHDHISKQGALICYFGALLNEVCDMLEGKERTYQRFKSEAYLKCIPTATEEMGGKKPTIDVINAVMSRDYGVDIQKWEEEIAVLHSKKRDLELWMDGLKNKSFAMREHVRLMLSEVGSKEGYSESDVSSRPVRANPAVLNRIRGGSGQDRIPITRRDDIPPSLKPQFEGDRK